jgi:hypothetical protein
MLTIGLLPRKSLIDYFYKNADADRMIFNHKGRRKTTHHAGDIV